MELIKKLAAIQSKLNAPKGQFNKFGKYNYRNCEDILQALKPILDGAVVLLTDEIVNIGDRFYVKATAKLMEGNESIEVSGFARECVNKKGMDDAQRSRERFDANGISDSPDQYLPIESRAPPREAHGTIYGPRPLETPAWR